LLSPTQTASDRIWKEADLLGLGLIELHLLFLYYFIELDVLHKQEEKGTEECCQSGSDSSCGSSSAEAPG
jgi:hypothetical protein